MAARWWENDEDSRDLAQGFFAAALEKGWLARFDPGRGRFRTYLLVCLDGYVAKEKRAGRSLKRGGAASFVPIETTGADGEPRELPLAAGTDLEAEFQREWARSLFALAVGELRARRERPSYAQLAAEHGLPVTQVTNHLHWARRELRAAVLEKLQEITASEEESRAEAKALLGVDAP